MSALLFLVVLELPALGVYRLLQILILADDLSGAADCGVACVGAGLRTLVALGHSDDDPAAEVLSLDSDTRGMAQERAAREVDRLIRIYAANKETLLFKKIDSTLRGNVGAELAAALRALRDVRNNTRTVAVMAPAFPAIGRTTKDGTQFVQGQPLHELDIWRVEGMTGHAYIPDLLHGAGLTCEVLGLDAVRSGFSTLGERMNLAGGHADVLVCDAETDDDLFAIDAASMKLDCRPLWVGSAGLAYQLPRATGLAKNDSAAPISLPTIVGSLLFVVGSLSRNSLEQVRMLSSMPGTRLICVPPDVLLAGEGHPDWFTYARELEDSMQSDENVVLSPKTEPRVGLSQRPQVAAALARMAGALSSSIGALIASGGETARAVFESLGVARLRLLGELEKGIPVSMTENWKRVLPVITKAGDFGTPDALLRCSQFLHSKDQHPASPLNSGKATR
jgi:D-threonate/D-erythronate kinase